MSHSIVEWERLFVSFVAGKKELGFAEPKYPDNNRKVDKYYENSSL